jgi:hypothetical protein
MVTKELLQFSYNEDFSSYDESKFFEEEGSEKFDITSQTQMLLMLQTISRELQLEDEYSIKKLEVMLHHELPFFAVNRILIKNWVLQNFMY